MTSPTRRLVDPRAVATRGCDVYMGNPPGGRQFVPQIQGILNASFRSHQCRNFVAVGLASGQGAAFPCPMSPNITNCPCADCHQPTRVVDRWCDYSTTRGPMTCYEVRYCDACRQSSLNRRSAQDIHAFN